MYCLSALCSQLLSGMADVEEDQDLDTDGRNSQHLRLCTVQEGLACDSVSRETVSVVGGEATRVGGLVTVRLVNVTIPKSSSRRVGTLPTSMRPSVDYYGTLFFGENLGYFKIGEDGSINAYSGLVQGDYTGSATFPVTA